MALPVSPTLRAPMYSGTVPSWAGRMIAISTR